MTATGPRNSRWHGQQGREAIEGYARESSQFDKCYPAVTDTRKLITDSTPMLIDTVQPVSSAAGPWFSSIHPERQGDGSETGPAGETDGPSRCWWPLPASGFSRAHQVSSGMSNAAQMATGLRFFHI